MVLEIGLEVLKLNLKSATSPNLAFLLRNLKQRIISVDDAERWFP